MSRVNTLNPDALKEVFAYDPETGILSWRKPWGKRPLGARAGTQRPDGYWVVNYKSEMFFVHRVAYAIHHGDITLGHIDHINGDPSDNRIANLRLTTARGNHQNRKAHRAGRLVGSCQVKSTGRWQSNICVDGKIIHLGTFATEAEASAAYAAAQRKLTEASLILAVQEARYD